MGSGANSDGAANQNGTVQQLKQQAGDQEATPRPSASLDGGGASGSRPHQFVVYAGHQGFVRLALEEGAWLVPVLALGEVLQVGPCPQERVVSVRCRILQHVSRQAQKSWYASCAMSTTLENTFC